MLSAASALLEAQLTCCQHNQQPGASSTLALTTQSALTCAAATSSMLRGLYDVSASTYTCVGACKKESATALVLDLKCSSSVCPQVPYYLGG